MEEHSDRCTVEFTERALEIKGPCAQGFTEVFEDVYRASKSVGAEISVYACVNPGTGSIDKVVLGRVGTPTKTSLPYGRVCPEGQRQVSMHTHPISGRPEFSETDAKTIASRMNEGTDDVCCVIGDEATQCFLRSLIPKKDK